MDPAAVLTAITPCEPAPVPDLGPRYSLWQLMMYFLRLGTIGFGGPVALIEYMRRDLVEERTWISEDAVAVALITPGPVVITTGFIGYLLAGLSGATVAATATFLPAYLFTIIPAPYFKKYGKRPTIAAFVDGVTSAAIGAISGAVIVLRKRSIIDVPTAVLAVATVVVLWKWKVPEPLIVLVAAGIGLILHSLVRG